MALRLRSLLFALFVAALRARTVVSHDHGHEEDIDPNVPIDSILWIHIAVQILVWGFMFPIGMVLGITRFVSDQCLINTLRGYRHLSSQVAMACSTSSKIVPAVHWYHYLTLHSSTVSQLRFDNSRLRTWPFSQGADVSRIRAFSSR